MASGARVERINLSDMSRTHAISTRKLENRMQAQQATHMVRLIGFVGSADECYAVQAMLDGGALPAKRLLTKMLEDVCAALLALCSITVVQNAPAASSYNAGTEINALATRLSVMRTGDDKNLSIYPGKGVSNTGGTTNTKFDPGFN